SIGAEVSEMRREEIFERKSFEFLKSAMRTDREAIQNEIKRQENEEMRQMFCTSFVKRDIDLESASEKTHQFPRVDISGLVDKKIGGGLWDYLAAAREEAAAGLSTRSPRPSSDPIALGLASVTKDETDLAGYAIEDLRPKEIVLLEREVKDENFVGESWASFLDDLRAEVAEKYPHHIPTSIETVGSDFLNLTTTIRVR